MRRGICAVVALWSGCHFDAGGVPTDEPDSGAPVVVDAAADAPGAADARPAPADARADVDARPPDAPSACPLSYARLGAGGTVYRLGNGNHGWDAAEADCEDDGVGTHLVVLDDADELTTVAPLLGDGDAWIGTTNRVSSATWLTVLGDVAPVQPWRGGAPSPGRGRACALLLGPTQELGNIACSRASRYVCECDGVEPDPAAF